MDHIAEWHPRRQLEWMAGRFLISEFQEKDLSKIIVHPEGKVFIKDAEIHLSISHCEELVGLQLNQHPVGLDIQMKTSKLQRVAHKFCSIEDYEMLEQYYSREEANLICWSMKEAVFKAYGLGNVNYKDDIRFIAFANDDRRKPTLRFNKKDSSTIEYNGQLSWLDDYCISQICKSMIQKKSS